MSYLTDLKWTKNLQDFSEDEQKILLALSSKRFKWRTKHNVMKASGLSKDSADRVLSALIDRDLVRPSFSKTKKVIFGLRQRVD